MDSNMENEKRADILIRAATIDCDGFRRSDSEVDRKLMEMDDDDLRLLEDELARRKSRKNSIVNIKRMLSGGRR